MPETAPIYDGISFNTQPPEGGCNTTKSFYKPPKVSTHSRLKAAESLRIVDAVCEGVSTHSRLKAAVRCVGADGGGVGGFNTQPRDGG